MEKTWETLVDWFFWTTPGLLIVVLGGLLVVGGAFGEVVGRHLCSSYERNTGKETRWALFDSCYVQTAQGWQRWDEYKTRATASEGLKRGAP